MSTFQIFASEDGGETFSYCSATGYFKDRDSAEIAVHILSRLVPTSIYEVRAAKRGRRRGQKDVTPRVRRTKEQLMALVLDAEGTTVSEENLAKVDNNDPGVTMSEALGDEPGADVLDDGDYVPLTTEQEDEMLHSIHDNPPASQSV